MEQIFFNISSYKLRHFTDKIDFQIIFHSSSIDAVYNYRMKCIRSEKIRLTNERKKALSIILYSFSSSRSYLKLEKTNSKSPWIVVVFFSKSLIIRTNGSWMETIRQEPSCCRMLKGIDWVWMERSVFIRHSGHDSELAIEI
jgi:hypothetical protein